MRSAPARPASVSQSFSCRSELPRPRNAAICSCEGRGAHNFLGSHCCAVVEPEMVSAVLGCTLSTMQLTWLSCESCSCARRRKEDEEGADKSAGAPHPSHVTCRVRSRSATTFCEGSLAPSLRGFWPLVHSASEIAVSKYKGFVCSQDPRRREQQEGEVAFGLCACSPASSCFSREVEWHCQATQSSSRADATPTEDVGLMLSELGRSPRQRLFFLGSLSVPRSRMSCRGAIFCAPAQTCSARKLAASESITV